MDASPARQVARRLGTSVPRVVRAVERLGLDVERDPGGRMRLLPRHVRRLESALGVTPVAPGLSPAETKVLGALARAPLGVPSIRAIARRAGVAPTTAAAAVERLSGRGLVRRELRTVARGSAREVELIVADVTHPDWARLAPELALFRPRQPRPRHREARVPPTLGHLFWNTAPEQLDTVDHGEFIARRLLLADDIEGLAWGVANLSQSDWEHASRARGIQPDRRSLAHNLAAPRTRADRAVNRGILDELEIRFLEMSDRSGDDVGDILAMKLKVVAERGELRDYFDLMAIETRGKRTVEEGIALFCERYGRPREPASAEPIVRALGYFDDLDDDLSLPVSKDEIAGYWTRRQRELLTNLSRFGGMGYR